MINGLQSTDDAEPNHLWAAPRIDWRRPAFAPATCDPPRTLFADAKDLRSTGRSGQRREMRVAARPRSARCPAAGRPKRSGRARNGGQRMDCPVHLLRAETYDGPILTHPR